MDLSGDVAFDSPDNYVNAVTTIMARMDKRVKWEMARLGTRHAQEKIAQGGNSDPTETNYAINPATGAVFEFSIPGMAGMCSGTTFKPKPG